jgi:hypothetical protein
VFAIGHIKINPVSATPMPLVHGVHSRVSARQGEPTLKVRQREFGTLLGVAGWHPFEATKS